MAVMLPFMVSTLIFTAGMLIFTAVILSVVLACVGPTAAWPHCRGDMRQLYRSGYEHKVNSAMPLRAWYRMPGTEVGYGAM
eukprot:3503519-Rhodomonas_salina.1